MTDFWELIELQEPWSEKQIEELAAQLKRLSEGWRSSHGPLPEQLGLSSRLLLEQVRAVKSFDRSSSKLGRVLLIVATLQVLVGLLQLLVVLLPMFRH